MKNKVDPWKSLDTLGLTFNYNVAKRPSDNQPFDCMTFVCNTQQCKVKRWVETIFSSQALNPFNIRRIRTGFSHNEKSCTV